MSGLAAIVLAGGAGRRLGGPSKPALPVAGHSMLDRVLGAVRDAAPVVVVGSLPVPAGVLSTVEDPPGSGPVAATAAGFALLPRDVTEVALLAADLPLLTPAAITHLRHQLEASTVDGALYVDVDGRRQFLCGVWRAAALRSALHRLAAGRGLPGASMRALLAEVEVREVAWTEPGPPPWFDCDTDDDLRQAEEWAR
ncbi:NTP transferase domain-containing protein [Phytohabitans sp. ZYX-F-186]|uniref:NTP transferase domain-containing protein n=1 Tax=Phytohabitans maris TaxID=3071409 RepID=A0ABU0ZJE3_9ACTN|nr:NTP transferase domain-containing protein [Phytohabitans sp. ZYX-F-186]MDQ7907088.1 NTP transferase domain-containing protein [Phytohabitans sp. ZYX-F-186]